MVVIYHGVPEKNEVYAWKIRFIRFLRQAQGAKSPFPAQNYYFFLICANISPFSSLYFSCGFPREIIRQLFCFCQWSGKSPLPLHLTLYTKKNRTKMRFLLHISPKSTTFASKYTQVTMEHKSCPRCGAAFICQHENPAKCQCAGVELSPAARAHLAAQYPNQCLCRKCLLEFSV